MAMSGQSETETTTLGSDAPGADAGSVPSPHTHPQRKGQKFERHQWLINETRTERICTVCDERQIKVSGNWTKQKEE